MRRGDIWLIALLVVIVAAFMLPRLFNGASDAENYSGTKYARIMVNGQETHLLELTKESKDIELSSTRGYNLLRIYEQGIEMIEADCPDQICKSYGFIDKVGQTIVCLPHRIFVEIVGDAAEGDGIDAIAN